MSPQDHEPGARHFVPPAAKLNAAVGIICVIGGIAATVFTWLCFETVSPAVPVGTGVAFGGILLVCDHWRRGRFGPPTLRLNDTGIAVEGAGQRVVISWNDLMEVRLIEEEVDRLEFRRRHGTAPVVIVVDHFTREQAEEIKRRLGF